MTPNKTRIAFFGSPTCAVPSLEALAATGAELVVITTPDRPVGRKSILQAPAVKEAASRLALPCWQPELLDAIFEKQLREWQPHIAVVVAYGKIFPEHILSIPERGFLNVHFSLLPKYRGASPVSAALLAGEKETGVTIMLLDAGLDTGPTLAQSIVSLSGSERKEALTDMLALEGAALLTRSITPYLEGKLIPRPQNGAATITKRLRKEDGHIQWSLPAVTIERMVRAYDGWPSAWTTQNEMTYKILDARISQAPSHDALGSIVGLPEGTFGVVCGDEKVLELLLVHPAGKKALSGKEFRNGFLSLEHLLFV